MNVLDKGRTGVLVKGREAGKKVVITSVKNASLINVVGQNVKPRTINFRHALWLDETVTAAELNAVMNQSEKIKEINLKQFERNKIKKQNQKHKQKRKKKPLVPEKKVTKEKPKVEKKEEKKELKKDEVKK